MLALLLGRTRITLSTLCTGRVRTDLRNDIRIVRTLKETRATRATSVGGASVALARDNYFLHFVRNVISLFSSPPCLVC